MKTHGNLVIKRRIKESFTLDTINGVIEITIVSFAERGVRVMINAPLNVNVVRSELLHKTA